MNIEYTIAKDNKKVTDLLEKWSVLHKVIYNSYHVVCYLEYAARRMFLLCFECGIKKMNRKYYTSSIMRLCARLLIAMRNEKSISKENATETTSQNSMYDYLRPQYFELNVKAALKCASKNFDDFEDLRSPLNALKLGYEIKRLVDSKMAFVIKGRKKETEEQCADFCHLLKTEWGHRVTKLARVYLNERLFSKEKDLPEPQDQPDIERLPEWKIYCSYEFSR